MKKILNFEQLNEFKNYSYITDDELLEMSNITYKTTGIQKVVLWIGPNPAGHWKRIKVSNVANKFDGKDCFTITIPDFKIIGDVNTSIITNEVMNKIIKFIQINIDIINSFSNYEISTEDLLSNLKSVE